MKLLRALVSPSMAGCWTVGLATAGVWAVACVGAPNARSSSAHLASQHSDIDAGAGAGSTVDAQAPVALDSSIELHADQPSDPCVDPQADCAEHCQFATDATPLGYDGTLNVDGRPFASGRYAQFGDLTMRFGTNEAFGHFRSAQTSPYVETVGSVAATQVWLFPREQIIQDGWIELLKVKMASANSIKNGTFVPLNGLPDWVSRVKDARDLRVACQSFGLSWRLARDPAWFNAAPYRLLEGALIPLALTETGPAVAHIRAEYPHRANIVTSQGRRAYVMIPSGDGAVAIEGWIPRHRIFDPGRRARPTVVFRSKPQVAHTTLQCTDIEVWVRSNGCTLSVMRFVGNHILRGALAPNGDFRVDLDGNSAWSPTLVPEDKPPAPLDPFVPKELLSRCVGAPQESLK